MKDDTWAEALLFGVIRVAQFGMVLSLAATVFLFLTGREDTVGRLIDDTAGCWMILVIFGIVTLCYHFTAAVCRLTQPTRR